MILLCLGTFSDSYHMPANAQAISNMTDWIILIHILLVTNWSSEELINLTISQRLLIHLPTPSAPHHLLSGRETKHQVPLPGKCQLVFCISDYALGFLVLSWFIWPRFLDLTKVERINHQDGLICFPFLWATTEILTCYCADCLLPTLQYDCSFKVILIQQSVIFVMRLGGEMPSWKLLFQIVENGPRWFSPSLKSQ